MTDEQKRQPPRKTRRGGCQSERASPACSFLSYRQSVRVAACHSVVVPPIQALPPAHLAGGRPTVIFTGLLFCCYTGNDCEEKRAVFPVERFVFGAANLSLGSR
jgi:hypothetical protein